MSPVTATYPQWRAAIVGAIRRERAAGFAPRKGSTYPTRAKLAHDLRARRAWFRLAT